MQEPLPDEDLMKCPNCAELIRKDAILCRFCEKGLSDEHFNPCPFCAESIRAEATFCRFCRSQLSNKKPDYLLSDLRSKAEKLRKSLTSQLDKLQGGTPGSYAGGVRQQVFEVIVRQAMAGADWREICAVPMEMNNITPEEVELELSDRMPDKIFKENLGIQQVKKAKDICGNSITDQSKFRQLLSSIETNQTSCCIKTISPKHKSRGIILVFRGQVVGCTYFNERLRRQLFGKEAYSCILADVYPQNEDIDSFVLSEDLVLAAASLFNGEELNIELNKHAKENFERAYHELIRSSLPGGIVVKSGDDTVLTTVYIFGGKIIGIRSIKEGWVSTTYDNALRSVINTSAAKISAHKLSASNVDEIANFSFSISGQDNPKTTRKESTSAQLFLLDIFGPIAKN